MRLKYKWECPLCHLICLSRNELYKHKKEIHAGQIFDLGGSCQYCNREFTHKAAKSCHEKYCKLNPNKIEYKGRLNSQETLKTSLKENILKEIKKSYRYHNRLSEPIHVACNVEDKV